VIRPWVVALVAASVALAPPGAPIRGGASVSAPAPALPKPVAVVPFDLHQGRVFLRVYVDGKGPGDFQLDSAAGNSCVSKRFGERIQLEAPFRGTVAGAGDGSQFVPLARDARFTVGSLVVRSSLVPLVDFDDLDLRIGRRTDGLIGVPFLKRYVIALDYGARTMTAYEPGSFEYHGGGTVLPIDFAAGGATAQAVVRVPDQPPLPMRLLLDAPHPGPLVLTSPFVDRHDLLASARRLTPKLVPTDVKGVGGRSAQLPGRATALEIGPYVFRSPVVLLSRAAAGTLASSEIAGLVGSQILRRFRVIFDFPHRRVVLEPGPHLNDAFPHDMSGLTLRAQTLALTAVEVDDVADGSPAAQAGVKKGDLLRAVNGRPGRAPQLPDIRALFERAGPVLLDLEHGNQRRTVVLELRPRV
jgi:hypothetical protein